MTASALIAKAASHGTSQWTWVAQTAVVAAIIVGAAVLLSLVWYMNRKMMKGLETQADTTNFPQLFGGLALIVFGAVMVIVFEKNGVGTSTGAVGTTVATTIIGAGVALLPGAAGKAANKGGGGGNG